MTGRLQILVTGIKNVCDEVIIRFWSGLHEIDLLLQLVYKVVWMNNSTPS